MILAMPYAASWIHWLLVLGFSYDLLWVQYSGFTSGFCNCRNCHGILKCFNSVTARNALLGKELVDQSTHSRVCWNCCFPMVVWGFCRAALFRSLHRCHGSSLISNLKVCSVLTLGHPRGFNSTKGQRIWREQVQQDLLWRMSASSILGSYLAVDIFCFCYGCVDWSVIAVQGPWQLYQFVVLINRFLLAG